MEIMEDAFISVTDSRNENYCVYGKEINLPDVLTPFDIVVTGHNIRPLQKIYNSPYTEAESNVMYYWKIDTMYPNPCSDYVTVKIEYSGDLEPDILNGNMVSLVIYEWNGYVKGTHMVHDVSAEQYVSLSSCPAGTYLMSLVVNGCIADSKMLIVNK